MAQSDENHSLPAGRHLNFADGSYLESTSRPLYALFFLLPWVLVYELGTLLVNTDQIAQTQSRVAAFTWLMGLAEWIGMHRSLAWAFPGFVVVVILLCWHLSSRHPWRMRLAWLGWMNLECIVLSLPLFVVGALVNSSKSFAVPNNAAESTAVGESGRYMANVVTGLGAGIYEELVFRLILIGLLVMLLDDLLKVKPHIAAVIAVFVSAGLFAAHHYVGIEAGRIQRLAAEPFEMGSFIFRAAAGLYFAVILRYRGYGITAGSHAAYNLIYFSGRFFAAG